MARCEDGGLPPCTTESSNPLYLAADSVRRLITTNFIKYNEDIVTFGLFLIICACSWQATYFLLKCIKAKTTHRYFLRRASVSPQAMTLDGGVSSARLSHSNAHTGSDQSNASNNAVADIRASGDGWETEEHFDPDYDANGEILLLMLNDVTNVPEETQESEEDDMDETNEILRQIIGADNEEEARSHAVRAIEAEVDRHQAAAHSIPSLAQPPPQQPQATPLVQETTRTTSRTSNAGSRTNLEPQPPSS